MTEEIFKAPRNKRPHTKHELEPGGSPPKRGRTKDDFYTFCSWILAYTQYDSWKQEVNMAFGRAREPRLQIKELRAQNNLSPMDSTGSLAESYSSESTLSSSSKDESLSNVDLHDSGLEDVHDVVHSLHRDVQAKFRPESDDESWELITCHCMKPYAGRPMIECSQCATWIHLSCAKIRKSNIPDTFVCQNCKESQFLTRKSNRVRTENKRITI